jgi:hypothetical protein
VTVRTPNRFHAGSGDSDEPWLHREGETMTAQPMRGAPPAGATPNSMDRPGRAKHRCANGAADVTGTDIVRISRTLAVEPWHFTETAPAATDDPAGIVFDKGRRRATLHLANGTHGCLFQIVTVSGESRCGLGDVAPISCRIYPVDPIGEQRSGATGVPAQAPASDDGYLVELLREVGSDREFWHRIIAKWNEFGGIQQPAAPGYTMQDFQRYLLEAQAFREATAGRSEGRPA